MKRTALFGISPARRRVAVIILAAGLVGMLAVTGCGKKAAVDSSQFFTGRSFTNGFGMTFTLIPPGTFMMGSSATERGRDNNELQHQVTIGAPFYLQTTEVSQDQWKKVMGDTPSYFKHCGPTCPVENVSWKDAVKFVQKLNSLEGTDRYRLPAEAEWEYACRAGTTTAYYTGDCITTDQANFNGEMQLPRCKPGVYQVRTTPPGTFAPNPWGLYDMHGNVWEWCGDNPPASAAAGLDTITGPASSEYKIRRGGSWDDSAAYLRSASRVRLYPEHKFRYSGFRVAADVKS